MSNAAETGIPVTCIFFTIVTERASQIHDFLLNLTDNKQKIIIDKINGSGICS